MIREKSRLAGFLYIVPTYESTRTNNPNQPEDGIMTKKQLFERAAATGKHLMITREHYLAIRHKGVTVQFWDDGSINLGDIQLDIAKNMTVTAAAKALKIS